MKNSTPQNGRAGVLPPRLLLLVAGLALAAAMAMAFQAWRAAHTATIVVEWTTASELDTAGFNLYRSQPPDGDFVRVNPHLIPPAPDPLTGGSYKFVDSGVTPGQSYIYELEEVEVNGQAARIERISVVAEGGGLAEMVSALALLVAGVTGIVAATRPAARQEERE